MKTNTPTFNVKLELLADELLNAETQEQRDIIAGKIKTLKEYQELLMDNSPVRNFANRKQRPVKTGRKSYAVTDIAVKLDKPIAIKFNYKQYVAGSEAGERPQAIVEAIFHGFLKVGNQGETTLAIESCDDVLDLKRCEIYGFQAKSLKDIVLVPDSDTE